MVRQFKAVIANTPAYLTSSPIAPAENSSHALGNIRQSLVSFPSHFFYKWPRNEARQSHTTCIVTQYGAKTTIFASIGSILIIMGNSLKLLQFAF